MTYADFGEWLTYAESVRSNTAKKKGIDNTPSTLQYKQMQRVYADYYVPICKQFGKLFVSSFFRSAALNKAIGGATSSAHMAGAAIDIDCDGSKTVSNKQLFDWCRKHLKYDQIILEHPDANGNPGWVHIAHNRDGKPDRQQVLKATFKRGKTVYETI